MASDDAAQKQFEADIPAFLLKRKEVDGPSIDPSDNGGDEDDFMPQAQDLVLDKDPRSDRDEASTPSDRLLFPGDRGELRGETRRALVALLAGPSVDGERQPKLWMVLKRDEAVIRSRLNDLYLELTVDDDNQTAFIRQVAQHGETDIPVLLRRQPLTFLQSAGLLILRAALASSSAAGQRAVIGGADLIADLAAYEDPNKSDKARFAKQCAAVVEALKRVSILRPIPGSHDRYEVSPTLALLLPADQLQALTETYERIREERGGLGARA
jgi:hypothetical protein